MVVKIEEEEGIEVVVEVAVVVVVVVVVGVVVKSLDSELFISGKGFDGKE